MMSLKRSAVWSAAALLLATSLAACQKKDQQAGGQQQAHTQQVGVVTIHPQRVQITTELPGRVSPSLIAEVRPQVNGIIQKRLFEEGSEVKEGDVLYQIDPSSYQAAFDSAEAAQQKAQAVFSSAQTKSNRYKQLTTNAVSQQTIEDASAAAEQANADVAAAKANLETARISLNYTKITAPISGRIGTSSLTQGALVTANQTTALATIQALDPIYVDVTQSASEILRLRREFESGQLQRQNDDVKAQLRLDDGTLYNQEGTLRFTDVTVGESTGTVSLRATFANPDRILLPGMFVRGIVQEGVNDKGLLIPQRGVSRNPRGLATALFVTADNKVEQRTIRVSRTIGTNWLVDSGAKDGDRVIVEGLQKVRSGDTVQAQEVAADNATDSTDSKPGASQPPAASKG
ncbi:membrane fusion protein, multidrug efflux system [Faunimonas pinastri]|uniref:Membrane fusion protein, multidrug efflux system n=1 Tax=Faunimonas pinastri TaxID=1855383 RepID=A0A1H9NGR7_9HYPH|nr:efflux RND transporter periplasmic adaptor subunit [Faunimonas pinastri]SER35146.1 membrane fusion protein, multidrug efflux system [Faunimonas pinastri]